jgi:hypothetical protein
MTRTSDTIPAANQFSRKFLLQLVLNCNVIMPRISAPFCWNSVSLNLPFQNRREKFHQHVWISNTSQKAAGESHCSEYYFFRESMYGGEGKLMQSLWGKPRRKDTACRNVGNDIRHCDQRSFCCIKFVLSLQVWECAANCFILRYNILQQFVTVNFISQTTSQNFLPCQLQHSKCWAVRLCDFLGLRKQFSNFYGGFSRFNLQPLTKLQLVTSI